MDRLVRAFPVLAGKEQDLEDFAREALSRTAEIREFYEKYGVNRESWHIQLHDHGTWLIGVTELGGRPVEDIGPEYAASHHAFDTWFKRRVHELSGIDPDTQPLGPPTRCIFDWRA